MGLETAAIIALGSAAAQTVGAGFSFAQAAKQKKELDKANKAAQKAIAEAKAITETNQLEGLQVPLEPYRTAMREGTAQQMQSLQALQESDARSLAAGVGKVGAVGTDYLERVRGIMSADMYKNDLLKAQEDARLQNQRLDIAQLEAEGAQQAAADAAKFKAQAVTQGVQGLVGAATTGLLAMPEYRKSREFRRVAPKGMSDADILTAMDNYRKTYPLGYEDAFKTGNFGNIFNNTGQIDELSGDFSFQPDISAINPYQQLTGLRVR